MVFVPTTIITQAAQASTRQSHELASRIEETIREFKKEHPELRDDEVQMALTEAARGSTDEESSARQRRIALAVIGAVVGVFAAVGAATVGSSRGDGGGSVLTWIPMAAVAATIVGIAIVRIVRRGSD